MRFLPVTLTLLFLFLSLNVGESEAFDPHRKPPQWAYSSGLINPEYLNLRKGLIAHWVMWENGGPPHNITPKTNTMIYPGGTENPPWDVGEKGPYLHFDGSNDYIDASNEPDFDFNIGIPFSISLWTRSDTGHTGILLNKAVTSGSENGYNLFFITDHYQVVIDASTGILIADSNTHSVNQWHHVVMTYNGGTTESSIGLYVNGVPDIALAEPSTISGSFTNNEPLRMGRFVGPFPFPLDGGIADLRVYDRVLLPEEVTALYSRPFADVWMAKIQPSPEQIVAVSQVQIIIISILGWSFINFLAFYRRHKIA